nr:hypothetical protein CFP56_28723 [Quercus suber]
MIESKSGIEDIALTATHRPRKLLARVGRMRKRLAPRLQSRTLGAFTGLVDLRSQARAQLGVVNIGHTGFRRGASISVAVQRRVDIRKWWRSRYQRHGMQSWDLVASDSGGHQRRRGRRCVRWSTCEMTMCPAG